MSDTIDLHLLAVSAYRRRAKRMHTTMIVTGLMAALFSYMVWLFSEPLYLCPFAIAFVVMNVAGLQSGRAMDRAIAHARLVAGGGGDYE